MQRPCWVHMAEDWDLWRSFEGGLVSEAVLLTRWDVESRHNLGKGPPPDSMHRFSATNAPLAI